MFAIWNQSFLKPAGLDQLACLEPRNDLLDGLAGVLVLEALTGLLLGRLLGAGPLGGDNSAAQWTGSKQPPKKEAGEIFEDEDTAETVEKIVAWLEARKLI